MKALLPLLCLGFITLAASGPAFQAVSKFDADELLDRNWYELIYANGFVAELVSCPREVYTCLGHGKISYQFGQYGPGIDGDFASLLLVLKQQGNSGKFKVVDKTNPDQYFYILDHDKHYDWIVYGLDLVGDENDVIVVISKTASNLTGIQRALDLAKKYQLNSHHLELQSKTCCDYDYIFAKLKKQRKNL